MSSLAIDTDVVSFFFKNHPIGKLYEAELQGNTLLISFMTVAELDRWALESKWGEARRNSLNRYLEPFVIIPYNRGLCTK